MNGWVLFLFALSSGLINVWLHTNNLRPDFFAKSIHSQDNILVQITEPQQSKETFARTNAKVIAIGQGTDMHTASGKLILYFAKDSSTRLPGYGDQVLIKNKVSVMNSVKAPGEFDYSKFMSYKGIYHSAYLKKGEWVFTGKNDGNPFWSIIYAINNRLKSDLANTLTDPGERGIAEALIIGDESDIPNDIMTDYAGTGTVHILSVSGLHVGIILIGLSWIFSFLLRVPNGKYIRLFLILGIIWCYAFLTGFSAPIARSVIMFSIVFIGMNIGRQANIYNSICGAAIILTLIDPFMIMQASFQLSFIALTGIVWLQPKIAAMWKPNRKPVKYIWELAAASLAAQIITLPISIFYFNQVSLYFLPANLIVIPASFVVLIAGILFVFATMIPLMWLHHIFSALLHGSIYGMNLIVKYINELPGATWQGLYVNPIGLLLLYGFIIFILLSVIYRNKKALAIGMAFGLCFLLARDADVYKRLHKDEMNIMAISSKHTVITIKDRNKLYVISDSGFTNDKQLMKYHVNGYAWQNYISPGNIVCLNSENKSNFSNENMVVEWPILGFYDKTILMINSNVGAGLAPAPVRNINAVVLFNNPRIRLSELYKKFRFKSVIVASGVNNSSVRDWETECIENNIPFFNLQKSNFLSISIS